MGRRLSLAVRLVALLGIAGGLSGCAVYATPGYAYRSPGFYAPPPPRPFFRPHGGFYGRPWGPPGGFYGRPWGGPPGGFYGRPWGGPPGGFYGRPYW